MKVLVACEFTQIIRDAFAEKGHQAYSCDFRPAANALYHFQCDVREIISDDWDLVIAHPPCPLLASSGSWCLHPNHKHKYPGREEERQKAIALFLMFTKLKTKRVCIENPTGIMTKLYRKPNQIIHPFYFGDNELKRTCLWLKNLPRLNGLVNIAADKNKFKPSPRYTSADGKARYFVDCAQDELHRSKTFPSIAKAMAEQWNF